MRLNFLQLFIISLLAFHLAEASTNDWRQRRRYPPGFHRGIAPFVQPGQRLSKPYEGSARKLGESDYINYSGKNQRRCQRPYKIRLDHHSRQDYSPTASEHLEVFPSVYNSRYRYEDENVDRMLKMMLGKTDCEEKKALENILYKSLMDGGPMLQQQQLQPQQPEERQPQQQQPEQEQPEQQQPQYQQPLYQQPQYLQQNTNIPKMYNCGKCLQCKKCVQHDAAAGSQCQEQCHCPKPLPIVAPILSQPRNCNKRKIENESILLMNDNNNNEEQRKNVALGKNGNNNNEDEYIFLVVKNKN